MARQKKDTIDYFPHPVKNGKRMFIMEQNFGDKGYVAYYKLLELLGATEGHHLDFKTDKDRMFFAASIRADDDTTHKIIQTLADLGAIDKKLWQESKIIFCQELVDSVSDLYNKRNRKPPSPPFSGPEISQEDDFCDSYSESKVKESKVNKSKVNLLSEDQIEYEKILLVQSEKFFAAWKTWLDFRAEIRKPYKSFKSMKEQILELKKYPESEAIEMIAQSIRQQWQGIFPIKNKSNGTTATNQQPSFRPGGNTQL